jgi:aspartate racemase
MIGLLGGLGVGGAIHYYRELAAAHDDVRRPMQLAMIHASISRVSNYAPQGDRQGLAEYLSGFLGQLKAAGATIGVLPAVTPHLCIDELKAVAPIPVIDLTPICRGIGYVRPPAGRRRRAAA